MRHGFINDLRAVFRTAIDHIPQSMEAYDSEKARLLTLQRDVIADLFRMHRVTKAMQDPPRKSHRNNWHDRNRRDDDYEYEDENDSDRDRD